MRALVPGCLILICAILCEEFGHQLDFIRWGVNPNLEARQERKSVGQRQRASAGEHRCRRDQLICEPSLMNVCGETVAIVGAPYYIKPDKHARFVCGQHDRLTDYRIWASRNVQNLRHWFARGKQIERSDGRHFGIVADSFLIPFSVNRNGHSRGRWEHFGGNPNILRDGMADIGNRECDTEDGLFPVNPAQIGLRRSISIEPWTFGYFGLLPQLSKLIVADSIRILRGLQLSMKKDGVNNQTDKGNERYANADRSNNIKFPSAIELLPAIVSFFGILLFLIGARLNFHGMEHREVSLTMIGWLVMVLGTVLFLGPLAMLFAQWSVQLPKKA